MVGQILGSSGADRFVLRVSAERVNGGDGIDTLKLSLQTARLTVDLSISANSRAGTVVNVWDGTLV